MSNFIATEFVYQNYYFTTLSDTSVRTGRIDTNQQHNAVYNPPNSFVNYEIRIPQTVSNSGKSYTVVEIGTKSFFLAQFAKIKSLPSTIKVISNQAFDKVSDYEFPSIPNVEYIGDLAFASNQYSTIYLPASITYIGDAAFSYDKIKSITFDSNTRYLSSDKQNALYDLKKTRLLWAPHLSTFIIPLTVQNLSSHIFASHPIEKIVLPPACSGIGYDTFVECDKLKKIIITGNIFSLNRRALNNIPSLECIEYHGTTKLIDINPRPSSIQVLVCNQYKWNTAFGLPVIKQGNCPLMNIIRYPTCIINKLHISPFVFLLWNILPPN